MLTHIRRAVIVSVVLFVICGLAYPALETGIGQLLFKYQADGSLSSNGSALIGQQWTGPNWFQGRADSDNPMATADNCTTTNFKPSATCSYPAIPNMYGPRNASLVADIAHYVQMLKKEGITATPDLVTPSASSVDPDISPADAYAQAGSVANARGLRVAQVDQLVANHVQGRELGFLGEPYVNVLGLNEALAELAT
jgi:K+-transporting ATPase ATPase C chain